MKTTKTINKKWNSYDKQVAACQLKNFEIIFLDEYNCPIDDEYIQEELFEEYKKTLLTD